MAWGKADPKDLRKLKGHLEELRLALQMQKVAEINKLESVLAVYDGRLKEKLQEVVDAGKVEQP
jgi:hypothetical protein